MDGMFIALFGYVSIGRRRFVGPEVSPAVATGRE
jgi:hypothetical protein